MSRAWVFDDDALGAALDEWQARLNAETPPRVAVRVERLNASVRAFLESPEAQKLRVRELDGGRR